MQSNYGGVLSIAGAPVGIELNRYYLQNVGEESNRSGRPLDPASAGAEGEGRDGGDGSIMIVVATDAPLRFRNLERVARRALAGLARTGSSMTNGSGDYVIAFSTVPVRELDDHETVPNGAVSPLFQATIEATEEAIYNSLFYATTVRGHLGEATALPLDSTRAILRRHGVIR